MLSAIVQILSLLYIPRAVNERKIRRDRLGWRELERDFAHAQWIFSTRETYTHAQNLTPGSPQLC
jgi:hypothetical protein